MAHTCIYMYIHSVYISILLNVLNTNEDTIVLNIILNTPTTVDVLNTGAPTNQDTIVDVLNRASTNRVTIVDVLNTASTDRDTIVDVPNTRAPTNRDTLVDVH